MYEFHLPTRDHPAAVLFVCQQHKSAAQSMAGVAHWGPTAPAWAMCKMCQEPLQLAKRSTSGWRPVLTALLGVARRRLWR